MKKLNHIVLFENFVVHKSDEPYKTNFSGLKGDDERTIQKGEKVRVFRNLNTKTVKNRWEKDDIEDFRDVKNVLWSIRNKQGKTIHHTYQVWLKNCTFPITEGKFNFNVDDKGKPKKGTGRRGVVQSGNKDIHAFVEGDIITWDNFNYDYKADGQTWVNLYYNPYLVDAFVVADTPENRENGIAKKKIISAEEVIMAENTLPNGVKIPMVLAKNPKLEEHVMSNPTKDNWTDFKNNEDK
jgi:hypothetical protein